MNMLETKVTDNIVVTYLYHRQQQRISKHRGQDIYVCGLVEYIKDEESVNLAVRYIGWLLLSVAITPVCWLVSRSMIPTMEDRKTDNLMKKSSLNNFVLVGTVVLGLGGRDISVSLESMND